jgi:hypothetical protein
MHCGIAVREKDIKLLDSMLQSIDSIHGTGFLAASEPVEHRCGLQQLIVLRSRIVSVWLGKNLIECYNSFYRIENLFTLE